MKEYRLVYCSDMQKKKKKYFILKFLSQDHMGLNISKTLLLLEFSSDVKLYEDIGSFGSHGGIFLAIGQLLMCHFEILTLESMGKS